MVGRKARLKIRSSTASSQYPNRKGGREGRVLPNERAGKKDVFDAFFLL